MVVRAKRNDTFINGGSKPPPYKRRDNTKLQGDNVKTQTR